MATVLITGAGSGIGEALALYYASTGANLLLIGRKIERLASVAEKCRTKGSGAVEVASLDVGDRASMESWISKMDSQYSIDILIANAGIAAKIGPGAIEETVNTNIFGVINTIQPCVPLMQKRKKGNIVIISSVAGILPMPDAFGRAIAAYCMSKRFVRVYGEGIRCLYSSEGVKVNVICPGMIQTDFSDQLAQEVSKMIKAESTEVVVSAVRRAITFNSPVTIAPFILTIPYRLLMPAIPFSLYSNIMVWIIKKGIPQHVKCEYTSKVKVDSNPKNIVITGASSGLGYALAEEYAANGKVLMLFGTDSERLQKTAEVCANKKAKTLTFLADIADAKRMQLYINECDDNDPIDLVIANAGISGGVAKAQIEHSDQIKDIVTVNVMGTINTIEPTIARMKQRKKGQVVIIASFLALHGIPGQPAYCASKAALLSYGESLRIELAAYNIGVTVVCCGYIRTPMSEGNPLTFAAIKPSWCARIIKRDAANNRAISIPPTYMSLLTQLANIALPGRIFDWLITTFYPRRKPLQKYSREVTTR